MFLRRLGHGCGLIALATRLLAVEPGAQGVIEGRLKIFPLSGVNLADDANVASPAAQQPYSEYPLIVRSSDGKKEIAHVTADKDGNYRLALPAGDYMLDVERRERGHIRSKPKPFSVLPGQAVRVDFEIDTGIR